MDRIEWESLPADTRDAVQDELGPSVKIEQIGEGRRSALAVVAHLAAGRVFLKGAPLENERAAAQLAREAAVNPHVQAVTPALVCDLQAGGWRLLGFEHVDGRRVDYTPGSRDLPAVLDALVAVDGLKVPADVDVQWFEGRWSDYAVVPERLPRIAGTALLHTDLNAGNALMTGAGARLVDWGMASRGAPLVNPADLVVNLIACGHTPKDAEAVVYGLAAWREADPEVVDYYARLLATTWLEAFWTPAHPWARAVVDAAVRWAMYRRDRH
ncbi:phosphotransferase [Actinomadura bangladeshensis]|uniref:Phosphotransferase n=1 Tax=Actinomadura bangladeshensis TaxID=453573 RepID=A0A6L9QR42_9ACTN|nr:phosphotransferase [Actinomadura bangladeshensis]NEA27392.1 phosphotransferase [Actinomadura bangladeshensis]